MRRAHRHPGGFTLVELLAVIMIIAIVVSIVVAVAGKMMREGSIRNTKMRMGVIMNAVQLYFQEHREYPTVAADALYPALMNPWAHPTPSRLAAQEQARKLILSLEGKALKDPQGAPKFLDGFEAEMVYHSTGGVGGSAYLESAGPDADFATTEDNIRSDRL